jgi:glucuronate isomerase
MSGTKLNLHEDRYFSAIPEERKIARHLYGMVKALPLVCPHGHVEPRLLAENAPFPDPAQLLVIPDHYLFRMLYSQGIAMEALGVPRADGGATESDSRKIWQTVADNFHLFRGTPTGMWLKHEMQDVLGVTQRLTSETAMVIYDQIAQTLAKPENYPRAMFERFKIEVLSTTDSPIDSLSHHVTIRDSGWNGKVVPAFRPDNVTDIFYPDWRNNINRLSDVSGIDCMTYQGYVQALQKRRAFFQTMGATSTDHGVSSPFTVDLAESDAAGIYDRALAGRASAADQTRFTGHMLMQMAGMSCEDGLVMQIHPGSLRNHNPDVLRRFGFDKGCDIPTATEYVQNLRPLLNRFGNDPRFSLIVFTLDETTFSRELAPLAGHYPALKLGPPWWFLDSPEGMLRYRKTVTETAGFYNAVGFIDDTRAFPSIPVRHDLARRIDCRYLASLVSEHVLDLDEAEEVIVDLSYHLSKKSYKL